jgi:hypothetical protein
MEYKVGQKLYVEYMHRYHSADNWLVVAKVGRKWVSLVYESSRPGETCHRVALDSTYLDGGNYSSPGRLWESKEAAQAHHALVKEWNLLKRNLEYSSVPEGVTLETIAQVRTLLNVPKKDV